MAKVKSQSAKGSKKASKRRVRFASLPKPPERIPVPYAKERDELKGLSCGELTEIVLKTDAYREEIGRILTSLDEQGQKQRGPNRRYTAWECEVVFLYQRVCGLRSVKEARDRLAGDRAADARRIFGFERARGGGDKRVRRLRDGIPSEATLCRHRQRFGERRRRGAYERLASRLTIEHLDASPEFREEARLLALDGTKIETHYQCPKIDPRSGKTVNEKAVTCADGGYVPYGAGGDKAGHGYNSLILSTMSGLPLASKLTPLNASESREAVGLVNDFKRHIVPHLDLDKVHVLSADGGFRGNEVRRALHGCGIVDRIHAVSHGDSEKSHRNARKHDQMRWLIEDHPNWHVNGHYELACACGEGRVSKEVSQRSDRAVVRTVGTCKKCGRISITAGTWRKVQNFKRKGQTGFRRCLPGERDQADYAFGNPLTYHDPIAEIYGNRRFGNGEGLFGALERRFAVNKGKRWIRRSDQARTDVAIVFSIIHALAIEQRRRARSGAPPGAAKAA